VTTPPASTRTPHDQATIAPESSHPEPTPPPAGLASAQRRSELMMVQPALPASQRVIRHAVARWLEHAHWPEEGVEDITLAVTEAVTNVVEHAYLDHDPGAIHLYAWITPMADPALIPAARPTTPDGRPALAAPPPPTGRAATQGRKVIIVVSDRGRRDPQRRTVDLNGQGATFVEPGTPPACASGAACFLSRSLAPTRNSSALRLSRCSSAERNCGAPASRSGVASA